MHCIGLLILIFDGLSRILFVERGGAGLEKAIIWDLDGTLFDSYHVIVESLQLAFNDFGVDISRDAIWQYAIDASSTALVQKVAGERGLDAGAILQRYGQISGGKYTLIRAMNGALETLEALQNKGVAHYIYTHRGRTTIPALTHLGMDGYFREILTSQSGFPRKPDPSALLYLMQKHCLSPETTYYAGDRAIDMDCARNAGIAGILVLFPGAPGTPTGAETYIVNALEDIINIV